MTAIIWMVVVVAVVLASLGMVFIYVSLLMWMLFRVFDPDDD